MVEERPNFSDPFIIHWIYPLGVGEAPTSRCMSTVLVKLKEKFILVQSHVLCACKEYPIKAHLYVVQPWVTSYPGCPGYTPHSLLRPLLQQPDPTGPRYRWAWSAVVGSWDWWDLVANLCCWISVPCDPQSPAPVKGRYWNTIVKFFIFLCTMLSCTNAKKCYGWISRISTD